MTIEGNARRSEIRPWSWCAAALALVWACTGTIGARDDPGEQGGAGGPRDGDGRATTEPAVGAQPLRRLTQIEYAHAVEDLVGVRPDLSSFPADEVFGGFASNAVTPPPARAVEAYQSAAEEVAARVDLAKVAGCKLEEAGCLRTTIAHLARRAFRKPLEPPEIDDLAALAEPRRVAGDATTGLRLAIEAILQAPSFLYRVEDRRADDGVAKRLDGFALAARLSFFLWSSIPDDALLEAAAAGDLETDDGVVSQATRMLADPRAARSIRSFHAQWLGLGHLAETSLDDRLFPGFDDAMRASMRRETEDFAEEVVLRGDRSFRTLMTAPWTIADAKVASLYGVTATGGKLPLPSDRRAGLLTQPSVLAVTSLPDQASPIHRGKLVRVYLLCQEIPDPPRDLVIVPPVVDPAVPTRDRFEQHRKDPACAGCHALMDPIGFGFSHYDPLGRWIDREAGRPVDARGELAATRAIDGSFDGAVALAKILADAPEVHDCYVRQIFRFATGRLETAGESGDLARAARGFVESGFDVQRAFLEIATSIPFTRTAGRHDGPSMGGP